MTTYRQGQRVKVEYEATVVACSDHSLRISPDHYPAGHQQELLLPPPNGLTVTVFDPPDWPPLVGDIWEMDGEEYFGEEWRDCTHERVGIVLQPSSHRKDTWAYADEGSYAKTLDDFKALNPVLVRRRGR